MIASFLHSMTPSAKLCRKSVASISRKDGRSFSASLANSAKVALKALSVIADGSQRNSRIFSFGWWTMAPQGLRTTSVAIFSSRYSCKIDDLIRLRACSHRHYYVSLFLRKDKFTDVRAMTILTTIRAMGDPTRFEILQL